MANKKNKQSKKTKSKKAARNKPARTKKLARKKKITAKKTIARKKPTGKPAPKSNAQRKQGRGKIQRLATIAFEPEELNARAGGQSGDLQGLSSIARADSESVDELIEEGNSFEAEVVKGVQDAPDADEGEVVTHEVSEDDVREEYRERDK
jgi:hypothetical protein